MQASCIDKTFSGRVRGPEQIGSTVLDIIVGYAIDLPLSRISDAEVNEWYEENIAHSLLRFKEAVKPEALFEGINSYCSRLRVGERYKKLMRIADLIKQDYMIRNRQQETYDSSPL